MKLIVQISILLITFQGISQELLKFTVDAGSYDRIDSPISMVINLEKLQLKHKDVQLVEIIKESHIEKPSQFDNNNKQQLWFVLDGHTSKNTIRTFAIIKKNKNSTQERIELLKKDGGLQLTLNDSPILNYQYKITYPPKGVDEKYKKSGFLHPVWSPGGEVLTRIQAPDHYHHYGIWGPWTKTHIEGREVDFWNLTKGMGSVLFKKFLNKTEGDIYSGFTALQEHLDFGATKENRVAINEELELKVWNLKEAKNSYLVDYTTTIKSPLESGILFDAYRYGGGIGFRSTEKWHKDNTSVLTSENKDRLTADGSSAKWAIIEGESKTNEGRSGILFMSFPENKEFPEPMRVWPVNANKGRGDMFFEFCPIRHVEWNIESEKKYQLNYRMLIFDGTLTPEQAEIYWQGFANPPKVQIIN